MHPPAQTHTETNAHRHTDTHRHSHTHKHRHQHTQTNAQATPHKDTYTHACEEKLPGPPGEHPKRGELGEPVLVRSASIRLQGVVWARTTPPPHGCPPMPSLGPRHQLVGVGLGGYVGPPGQCYMPRRGGRRVYGFRRWDPLARGPQTS